MRQPVFKIITLGCKVNQCESAMISAKLREGGYRESGDGEFPALPAEADITLCIVNTCTVTEKASMQSRQAIRQVIRQHPDARVVVTGCYAQTQPEEIEQIKGVHDIFGHCEKHCIAERLLLPLPPPGERDPKAVITPWYEGPTGLSPLPGFSNRTRAFLKVQDGCNAHCTYCVVPQARGKSRSMPLDQVLGSLRRLENAGHREIVLSGIHLGSYGKDFDPPTSLPTLLSAIEAAPLTTRIRLSSIEPMELTEKIITLTAQSDRFCPHFHIPLQSGDDDILKKMGRPYTATFFKDLVLAVHERIPEAAIGVDILVGFPGETDAAFAHTYDLIESLPVTYLHVFPFSPRAKTPAARLPDPLPPAVLKARTGRMRAMGAAKKRRFYDRFLGKTTTVLVEGKRDRNTGYQKGTTPNYIPVFLLVEEALNNRLVQVVLTNRIGDQGMRATVVSAS